MKSKILIFLIFLLGLFIFSYPKTSKVVNKAVLKKEVETFQEVKIPQEEKKEKQKKVDKCNTQISEHNVTFIDPFSSANKELDQSDDCKKLYAEEKDDEIFASLEIPKLNLMLPVYLGSSQYILSKAIGHVEGSSLPVGGKSSHTILSGHRGMIRKEMFRNIDKLKPGDLFYIHVLNDTLTYQVYSQEIVKPHEIESLVIIPDKDLVTLFSCHPFYEFDERILVHGQRVN